MPPMMYYPPTIRNRDLAEPEEQEDDPFSVNMDKLFVDKDCQVSNDPPEDGSENTDVDPCHRHEFRCNATTTTTEEEIAMVIPYQYELQYNPAQAGTNNFARLVSYVEDVSLGHVAAVTGLLSCSSSIVRHRRRRGLEQEEQQQQQNQTLLTSEQQSRLLGVAKDPTDVIDSRFPECLVAVNNGTDSDCAAMTGGITLYLSPKEGETAAEQQAMQDAIRAILQSGMESDQYTFPGTIDKVVFVKDRSAPFVASAAVGSSDSNDDDMGVTVKGLVFGSAALLALLLVVLAMTVLRKKRTKPVVAEDSAMVAADGGSSLDGSLADKDSLALQPQLLQPIPDEALYLEEIPPPGDMHPGPGNTLVVIGCSNQSYVGSDLGESLGPVSTFDSVYVDHEETSRRMAKYSDMESCVLAEAESQEQKYVSDQETQETDDNGDEEEGEGEGVPRGTGSSCEYSLDTASSQGQSEAYETASDYTPRGTLQMN